MWGPHALKTWATSQSTIALSSGEAELYAMTKMAVQIKGLMSLAADFSMELKGIVRSDSTAAIGIAYREGLGGRCRHINVQYLWIQESVRSGRLGLSKVLGKDNPADMMTKAVGAETLQQHLRFMNFRSVAGRAVKASKLLNSVTASADTSSVGGCRNSHPVGLTENHVSTTYELSVETASIVAQETTTALLVSHDSGA